MRGGEDSQSRRAPDRRPALGALRHLRLVISVALLSAAIVFMALESNELSAAAGRLAEVSWGWVVLALAAETGSMLAFARLQQRLLHAGGARPSLRRMSAITTAGNAVDATLPGGVAWAAGWLFHQLGRVGVRRVQRVWMFLVAGGVSSFALFVVVSSGVVVAGSSGPFAGLRWLVFLLAAIPLATVVVGMAHRTGPVRRSLGRLEQRMEKASSSAAPRWSVDGMLSSLASVAHRFLAVRVPALGWVEVLALALANWLLDCAVVVLAMVALHVAVPWRAILLVYGFTQISAAFPITPGGLGVVEGSLVALLHGYGVGTTAALATAALYRILTFWVLVPLGWAIFAGLSLAGRRAGHEPITAAEHEPITAAEYEPITAEYEPITAEYEPITAAEHEPIAGSGRQAAPPPAPLSVPVWLAPASGADANRCGRVRDRRLVDR